MSIAKHLNGGMLRLARKRRGIGQTELATESGVPQAAISRIENGTKHALSSEEIQSIARVLGFPEAFFFEQEPLYRRPVSLHGAAFRKKASVSMKDQESVVALANQYVLQLGRMLEAVDIEPQFKLLQFEIVGTRLEGNHAAVVGTAAEAAQKVRASWQVGDGPLLGLTRYIEATGVFVLFADFGSADIDGLTLRPIGFRPVIVLNKNRPADRIRFSLAHEYGHVILHSYPYEEMEKEANEFAAELLLPKQGVLNDLQRRLTLPELGRLKQKWHTAMSALIYRAKELKTISDTYAISLYKQMNMYGYRTKEPTEFDVPIEEASLSSELLQVHFDELSYTVEELASALITMPVEFAEMYGLQAKLKQETAKPKIKLVVNNR